MEKIKTLKRNWRIFFLVMMEITNKTRIYFFWIEYNHIIVPTAPQIIDFDDDTTTYISYVLLVSVNTEFFEELCAGFAHHPGRVAFIASADLNTHHDLWTQLFMVTPAMPLTPLEFKTRMAQAIPSLDWDPDRTRVHGVRDYSDAEMIIAWCSQNAPIYRKEPMSYETTVLSHFMDFYNASFYLCDEIMKVVLEDPTNFDTAKISNLSIPSSGVM